jgi:hypothetical protein
LNFADGQPKTEAIRDLPTQPRESHPELVPWRPIQFTHVPPLGAGSRHKNGTWERSFGDSTAPGQPIPAPRSSRCSRNRVRAAGRAWPEQYRNLLGSGFQNDRLTAEPSPQRLAAGDGVVLEHLLEVQGALSQQGRGGEASAPEPGLTAGVRWSLCQSPPAASSSLSN